MRGNRSQEGQSTVELALLLPFIVALSLTLVQLALVVRAQILVVHTAREGARVAAVGSAGPEVRQSATMASGLDPTRMRLEINPPEPSLVRVRVVYRVPIRIPLIGAFSDGVDVSSSATMMMEGP